MMRWLYTIADLKRIQICFRIWYPMRSLWRKWTGFSYPLDVVFPPAQKLAYTNYFFNVNTYQSNNSFKFLNKTYAFDKNIEWDFSGYGKLWTYQLQYFDFLHQESADAFKENFDHIIADFIEQIPYSSTSKEPYPIAVRMVNWVKYFSIHGIPEARILKGMYSQLLMLEDQLEYQHLANHLMENAFGLLFGGIFFSDPRLYSKGRALLLNELNNQILNDGAHFELSPMYHSLLSYRLLDLLQMLDLNQLKVRQMDTDVVEFTETIRKQIFNMLNWLKTFAYRDGSFAHFNDSTNGIAPTSDQLFNYGAFLGWKYSEIALKESGYRHLTSGETEIIIKAGPVGPSYNVAHAHADSLSFTLFHKSSEIIVDRGISTYEKNALRQEERGTESHNTVVWNGQNSSDIWGGFRVGKKAVTMLSKDENNHIIASHNGYPVQHERSWYISENKLIISDKLKGHSGIASLHFSPQSDIVQEENYYKVSSLKIYFENADQVHLGKYNFCEGFNKVKTCHKMSIDFKDSLTTTIEF